MKHHTDDSDAQLIHLQDVAKPRLAYDQRPLPDEGPPPYLDDGWDQCLGLEVPS